MNDFDSPDDPRIAPHLPSVGCAICGQTRQVPMDDVAHWDDLSPTGVLSPRQLEALAQLSAWSLDHEKAHNHDQEEDQQ